MNSLYKIYINKTIFMFLIGIPLSILFTYLAHNSYFESASYYTYTISIIFSDYSKNCFLLNIVLTAILIYNFFMYRNKRTGIFIKQLPVKPGNEFVIKSALVLILISALTASELLIFKLIMTNIIEGLYHGAELNSINEGIYIISLEDLYNDYYNGFKNCYILTLFVSSAMFLFSACIGVTGFSIAMPFIVFLGFTGFLFGFNRFITELRLNLDTHMAENLNYIINRLRFPYINISFEISYPYVFELSITFILYIISYFCVRFVNYSKIGQLFLFKWAKVLTYFFGCIFGGFSFYYIGSGILTPDSTIILVLILFISAAISYIIISKIEKVFI